MGGSWSKKMFEGAGVTNISLKKGCWTKLALQRPTKPFTSSYVDFCFEGTIILASYFIKLLSLAKVGAIAGLGFVANRSRRDSMGKICRLEFSAVIFLWVLPFFPFLLPKNWQNSC